MLGRDDLIFLLLGFGINFQGTVTCLLCINNLASSEEEDNIMTGRLTPAASQALPQKYRVGLAAGLLG